MPSSPNKGYTQPAFNTEVGTWGVDLNNNFSGIVDNNLAGVTSVALSSSNVTLTSTQAQNLTIVLTGTLTANIVVSSPCIGFFFVVNNTTGNFAVSLQANFGSGNVGSAIVVPNGGLRYFFVSDTASGVQYAAAPSTGTPVGAIQQYAGSSAPAGWLLCYGQAISRTLYSALFAVISTTYGVGDGSSTFNLPDCRGRAMVGLDNMGGSDAGILDWANTLGTTGGEQYHSLTSAENGPHTHSITDPGHSHPNSTPTTPVAVAGGATYSVWYSTLSGNTGSATTGIIINSSGSGTGHNTMQPSILFNTIIRAF